ncbi:MAG: mandelate racemase, partial [Rhodospirillales bacterium]|nr:mandelate racemase [Rhodospirillales bacterium]
GHGMTSITREEAIAPIIDRIAGPALIGEDPLATEKIWDKLYWMLLPRGQTGFGSHAIAAIDIALWDIKGKALGQPIWRLLGGARARVPVYATFGFDFFDRDQLAAAAKLWVVRGNKKLKMTVGNGALQRRDAPRPLREVIAEDVERVRAVREAVGPDIELFIDANCSLDQFHAIELARRLAPYGIAFFEEPITQNDVRLMAQMRRLTGMPLACGQNEGLLYRFRDLLLAEAVDYLQPNVVTTSGFTQGAKVAALAAAFNLPIVNGGAWMPFNMHLQAGLANGTMVEDHFISGLIAQTLYRGVPTAVNGWLTLPETPGLGFEPDRDVIRELAKRPPGGAASV